MWGYFGYEILFSIPIIGFIFILVFSFGGTNNINLRNFARSYFCVLIILLIIVGFLHYLQVLYYLVKHYKQLYIKNKMT